MEGLQELLQRTETIQKVNALQEQAGRLLFSWPALTGKDRMKRAVRRYLLRRELPPVDHYSWPNALLAAGLSQMQRSVRDNRSEEVLIRYYDRYDPSREFEPWLTRICVNTYRSTLRRMIRSPVFPFHTNEEKDAAMEKLAAPEKEDYAALYAAIDQLPEKLRVTVILFYFRDMDITSVSAVLGMPAGTVKSRLHKARKLLREVLGNETDLRF